MCYLPLLLLLRLLSYARIQKMLFVVRVSVCDEVKERRRRSVERPEERETANERTNERTYECKFQFQSLKLKRWWRIEFTDFCLSWLTFDFKRWLIWCCFVHIYKRYFWNTSFSNIKENVTFIADQWFCFSSIPSCMNETVYRLIVDEMLINISYQRWQHTHYVIMWIEFHLNFCNKCHRV